MSKRGWCLAMLAVLLAACSSTALSGGSGPGAKPADQPASGGTEFYDVGTVAPGAPGEILRMQELDGVDGVRVWRVLYRSTGLDGAPIAVSGLVAAPSTPPPSGGWPVIGFGHGTTGLADACAPSRNPPRDALPLVQAGYVVAATDYEGLGTPGQHPYIVGLSAGRSVLDAVRAARTIPEAATGPDVALVGHSQGGHAVLWAGQLAASYAPELGVRAIVAGSPAGDLTALLKPTGDRPSLPGNVELFVRAWQSVYGLPVDRVLDAADQERLSEADVTCRDQLSGVTLRTDLTTDPDWAPRLLENSPGAERATAPILYLQGTQDDQISVGSAHATVARLCQVGDVVEYREFAGEGHDESLFGPGRLEAAAAWIGDRLRGVAANGTCG